MKTKMPKLSHFCIFGGRVPSNWQVYPRSFVFLRESTEICESVQEKAGPHGGEKHEKRFKCSRRAPKDANLPFIYKKKNDRDAFKVVLSRTCGAFSFLLSFLFLLSSVSCVHVFFLPASWIRLRRFSSLQRLSLTHFLEQEEIWQGKKKNSKLLPVLSFSACIFLSFFLELYMNDGSFRLQFGFHWFLWVLGCGGKWVLLCFCAFFIWWGSVCFVLRVFVCGVWISFALLSVLVLLLLWVFRVL